MENSWWQVRFLYLDSVALVNPSHFLAWFVSVESRFSFRYPADYRKQGQGLDFTDLSVELLLLKV